MLITFEDSSTDKAQQPLKENNSIKTSESSPYKEFDDFLISLITPGKISKIDYYENHSTGFPIVVYNVQGYRYCSNIHRCHKNNKGEPSLKQISTFGEYLQLVS